jgi:hypothetical protein
MILLFNVGQENKYRDRNKERQSNEDGNRQAVALGVNGASNTTARQKKAAARRKEDTSRIVPKS